MTKQTHEPYKGFNVITGQYLTYEKQIYFEVWKDGVLVYDTMWLDLAIWQTHEAAYEAAKQQIDKRWNWGADPAKWMEPMDLIDKVP
jgi:hypothetical protein